MWQGAAVGLTKLVVVRTVNACKDKKQLWDTYCGARLPHGRRIAARRAGDGPGRIHIYRSSSCGGEVRSARARWEGQAWRGRMDGISWWETLVWERGHRPALPCFSSASKDTQRFHRAHTGDQPSHLQRTRNWIKP